MATYNEEDKTVYIVTVNHEEQYSMPMRFGRI
jgi:uncharacterized protein YbdZ (MbtH family)